MDRSRDLNVLGRRLDALKNAIERGDQDDIEWHYDNVRSAFDRLAGTRQRPYDQTKET